jgi:hypothetical protein
MSNMFETLSAENETSAFAKMTPEEHAEYCSHLDYLDTVNGSPTMDENPA